MKQVYQELGGELKSLRQVAGESVEEASDAVEIPIALLRKVEAGTERPEEDILTLLLSHYEVEELQAIRLWRLAGYDNDESENDMAKKDGSDKDENQLRINIPGDSPVLYTDMVQVMSNQYGLVLHFLQLSPNQQATVVSRIGMSKEHAQSLLELLKRNLEEQSD